MSASDKKKVRKEQANVFLTERQQAEQAEAKKLKVYTITFVTTMLLVVVIALGVLGVRAVNNSGIIQKNTIAATVGDRELNTVELGYYYSDAISEYYNDMYNQFTDYTATYLEALGLNPEKPLNEQVQDNETGKTWAEFFAETAIEQARNDYAMYDLAVADDFKLPEDEQANLDSLESNLTTYASMYGYSNANQYLRAMYGFGSDVDSYVAYCQRSAIADAYIADHHDNLSYDDAAIREHEKENEDKYSSFDYHYSYMSYTEFREGGTESEGGAVTYSDAENQAARDALKAAADKMAAATNLEELKAISETIEVNKDSEIVVNEEKHQLYTEINGALAKWLADDARKEGDIAAIPNESTVTNEDGTESTVVNGYYVALFVRKNDNKELMSNVRHLLVEFECDEDTEHEHSDEEKAKAKTEAEGYLKTWTEGEKTEESFIELVKEHSDDTSAEDGGLFEHINPDSQYVPSFLNWSIDDARKPGDCEIIESEYGYHVMYYVGDDDMTYRDYMITEELRTAEHDAWYDSVIDAVKTEIGDISKLDLDITIL